MKTVTFDESKFVVVPVVPTDEMETAAEDDYEQTGATFPRWKSAYVAMLAAAPTPPASAQDDAKDERQEWMACDMRHRMVTDNLKYSAEEMRAREKRCRNAYQLEYMGAPMRWLADAYAEAAAVFEAKLAAIAQQSVRKGE